MLVLATFLSICAVFVAFLLRFVIAIESDVRTRGKHSAQFERVRNHRAPSLAVVQGAAPKLTLVHSNSSLAPQARLTTSRTRPQVVSNSRVKEA
jgi:hypothetical protein